MSKLGESLLRGAEEAVEHALKRRIQTPPTKGSISVSMARMLLVRIKASRLIKRARGIICNSV